jgi:hypothetical protein
VKRPPLLLLLAGFLSLAWCGRDGARSLPAASFLPAGEAMREPAHPFVGTVR